MAASISVDEGANKTNLGAMEAALNIPEILEMIINRLDGPSTAKSARLVSSQWDKAVLSATKPLLTLNLNKFNVPIGPQQKALSSPKLCRKIVVRLPTEYRTQFDLDNFYNICVLYGDFVENAYFRCSLDGYDSFIIPTIGALNNFRNIQVLRMKFSAEELGSGLKNVLATKPKLAELTFLEHNNGQAWFPRADWNSETMKELSSLLQKLVDAAPNLKRLDCSENLYPNLAGCSKLYSLVWKGHALNSKWNGVSIPRTWVENEYFDLGKLTILLNQEDRLLKHGQIPKLAIPPMPNLTVFKTKSLVLSPFPGFSHFPRLQVLGLCQKREMWSDGLSSEVALALEESLLACLPTQQDGYTANITKFKTDAIHNPDNYGRLSQIFPNLQQFSFWLRQEEEGPHFGNTLAAVRDMLNGMKKIQIVKASLPAPLPDLGELIRMRSEEEESGPSGVVRLKVKMLRPMEGDDSREMFDRCNLWIPLKSP